MGFPPRGMILAAGFGSRLGTLGATRPKPMLPVCGAPLVRWSVEWMRVQGIREIAINLHHHGDQIRSALGDGSLLGVSIAYFDEPEILGTGGGIRNARSALDRGDGAPIVVVNGKLIHDIHLGGLLEQHAASGAEATMVVRKDLEGIWGAGLAWDSASQGLTKFLDESSDAHDSKDLAAMFCGVHVMQPEFLDRIPKDGSPCIARTAYLDYFREHGSIPARLHEGYWWEHSTPERYARGVAQVLRAGAGLSPLPGSMSYRSSTAQIDIHAHVHPQTWIEDDVVIEAGARVGPGTQILRGARIGREAQLEDCVVMEDVFVNATHRGSVILSDLSDR